CWRSRLTIGSLGRTITTGDRPLGPRVAPWPSWSGSATGSPSNPQHERQLGSSRYFLSRWRSFLPWIVCGTDVSEAPRPYLVHLNDRPLFIPGYSKPPGALFL